MDEQAEEQVVGAMAWCETCDAKTVHVDGRCRDHEVIRRKKARPAKPPSPPPRSFARIVGAIAIGLLVIGYVVISRLPSFSGDKPAARPRSVCDDEEAEIARLRREVASLEAELAGLRK